MHYETLHTSLLISFNDELPHFVWCGHLNHLFHFSLRAKVYNTYVEFPHFALIKFSTTSITRVHKGWCRKMRIVVVTWLALNARVWDTGCRPTYYCWGIISDTHVVPSTHFYLLTCTWGAIHLGRVETASPRENHGNISWVFSTPKSPVSASLH